MDGQEEPAELDGKIVPLKCVEELRKLGMFTKEKKEQDLIEKYVKTIQNYTGLYAFFFVIFKIIYFWLCQVFVAELRLLTAVASLVAEHRFQTAQASVVWHTGLVTQTFK